MPENTTSGDETNKITDATDCTITIGDKSAGTSDGRLVIDDFEVQFSNSGEPKYGVGNKYPVGRTQGQEEINVSFTHIGEGQGLAATIEDGDFSVSLSAGTKTWDVTGVDYDDYSVSVSNDGDFEIDFDGRALGYTQGGSNN